MRVFERWTKVVYLGEFTFCGSSISCYSFSPTIILQPSVKALDGNNMDTKVNGNIISASISAPTSSDAVKCFPEGIYLISEPSKPHLLGLFGAQICWHAAESTQNMMHYPRNFGIKLCWQI